MRLPSPSPLPEFDLPYEDLDPAPIPLRCFRFVEGLTDRSRTIVCVPGMAASGISYARLRPLADRYDLRLLSAPVEEYPGGSRRAFAEAVEAYLRDFDRAVLMGTSFGSMVTIEVASRAQEKLRGLILPAAFARNHAFPPPLRPMEKLLPRLQWLAAPLASFNARFVGGFGIDRAGGRELARQAAEVTVGERRRRLEEVFETDLRGLLPEIQLPSIVIHGRRDRLVSKRDALELAALLPHCEFHEIGKASHVPYFSHPREFLAIVEPFLEKVFGTVNDERGR